MYTVRRPVIELHDHFAQPVLRLHSVQLAGDQQTVDGLRLGNEQYCTVALSRLGVLPRYTVFSGELVLIG